MEDGVDVVVVGGGVIGCSVALELASRQGLGEVFLLEKGHYLGDGTSTRNSYVIHAGLYYPEDSLKARFCVAGNREHYRFCEQHRIPFKRTGKVILASCPEEIPVLEKILQQGERNGVRGLKILNRNELEQREPSITGAAALLSPTTGVFDVAQWFRVVEGLLYDRGVTVLKKTPVIGLLPGEHGVEVETGSRGQVLARYVVNAAGLYADEVANLLGNRFRIFPVRGDYFTIAGPRQDLVNGAVYPTPGTIGLGIHLTRLWDGNLLVGPDARPVESKEDYRSLPVFTQEGDLDQESADFLRFYTAVKSYFPLLEKDDLRLAHCGIRPSLKGPGEEGFRDFHIQWDTRDPRVIHLVGIDSPGLTAAPAIARYVAGMIQDRDTD